MPTVPVHVGTHLRRARKQAGLTQADAADRAGVSAARVSQWEGGAGLPGIRHLFLLADAYRVSLDDLLGYPIRKPSEGA